MSPQEANLSVPLVSGRVSDEAGRYCESFLQATPYKHLIIENFFEPSFAERLLDEFPRFDPEFARNELGNIGGKAVKTKIREISPAYRELYDTISGRPFLELVSRVSGIPDLILDPKMYGGGTHENLHGQELDAHVDFNYDEAQQLHRRLNLIVYLNHEWETAWGGAIEIHSNPRDPDSNRIKAYDPLFNRCVLFETNEISWHGFPKINLPPDKRHLSRKSISIYLYTKTRPPEEIVPMHGTFYVQRPLPEHISAGHTLTEQDVNDIKVLLARRDTWIEQFHKMELEKNRQIAQAVAAIHDLTDQSRVALSGYALQTGAPAGIFPDQWVSSHAEVEVRPLAPVSGLLLRGWRPDAAPPGKVRLSVGDSSTESPVPGGSFEITLRLKSPLAETFVLKIDAESQGRPVDSSDDLRDLQFRLSELRALHPLMPTLAKMLGKGLV